MGRLFCYKKWYTSPMNLTERKCIPCEDGSMKPLTCDEARTMMSEYSNELSGWIMSEDCTRLTTERMFTDFVAAMQFVTAVAACAEAAGHHPDIAISYNRVELTLFTHSIKGLSENDFIVAAQINKAYG